MVKLEQRSDSLPSRQGTVSPEGRCQCPPSLTCPWARHLNHLFFQRQPSRLLLCSEPFGIMSTWMLVKRGYARKYISPLTLLERILMFKRCFPLPLHGPLQRPHFMLWDTSVAFQKSTVPLAFCTPACCINMKSLILPGLPVN